MLLRRRVAAAAVLALTAVLLTGCDDDDDDDYDGCRSRSSVGTSHVQPGHVQSGSGSGRVSRFGSADSSERRSVGRSGGASKPTGSKPAGSKPAGSTVKRR